MALDVSGMGRLYFEKQQRHGREELLVYLARPFPPRMTARCPNGPGPVPYRHAHAFSLTAGMKGDTLILLTRLPERQTTSRPAGRGRHGAGPRHEPSTGSLIMAASSINLLDPGLGIQNIMDPGRQGHLPDARPLASSAMREAGLDELYNSRKAAQQLEAAPLSAVGGPSLQPELFHMELQGALTALRDGDKPAVRAFVRDELRRCWRYRIAPGLYRPDGRRLAWRRPPPLTTGQGRALQVLGHLFLRMGQFQRARKLALALLALDPADLWARRCLAVAWLELGDPERALEQLDLVLAGGPLASRDAVLHLLRARALWQAQRPDEARNALNAYLAAGEAACEPVLRRTQHRLPDHAPQ